MEEVKMSWFIKCYEDGTLQSIIWKCGKMKGVIRIPTGGGKSGHIINNIVDIVIGHIANTIKNIDMNDNKKFIFHTSANVLKLIAQLMSDANDPINHILKDKIGDGRIYFFVNSSASGDDYVAEYGDKFRFDDIDKFKNDPNAKVAFVASCHKSLYKFAEKIDDMNEYADVITYLDECHLVKGDVNKNVTYSFSNDGEENWVSLVKKLCSGVGMFALSATPDSETTKVINRCCGYPDDYFIIDISAQELIKENVILPIHISIEPVDKNIGICAKYCIEFMERCKLDNPDIFQKQLVNCGHYSVLVQLRDELERLGYKVFSTCSREGVYTTDHEEEDADTLCDTNFIKSVDDYQGDCFVLHLKQLVQGIDIKTLTGAIMYEGSHQHTTKQEETKNIRRLQTTGRVIRPMMGERGKPIDERIKKYGYVLYLVNDDDFDNIKRMIARVMIDYYGVNNLSFNINTFDCSKKDNIPSEHNDNVHPVFKSGGFGIDWGDYIDVVIEEISTKVHDYVKRVIVPNYYNCKKAIGEEYAKRQYDKFLDDVRQQCPEYDEVCTIKEIVQNHKLMDLISKFFNEFGIKK